MTSIGNWDITNLEYAILPACLYNGQNPDPFPIGKFPVYTGLGEHRSAELIDFSQGFGYYRGRIIYQNYVPCRVSYPDNFSIGPAVPDFALELWAIFNEPGVDRLGSARNPNLFHYGALITEENYETSPVGVFLSILPSTPHVNITAIISDNTAYELMELGVVDKLGMWDILASDVFPPQSNLAHIVINFEQGKPVSGYVNDKVFTITEQMPFTLTKTYPQLSLGQWSSLGIFHGVDYGSSGFNASYYGFARYNKILSVEEVSALYALGPDKGGLKGYFEALKIDGSFLLP